MKNSLEGLSRVEIATRLNRVSEENGVEVSTNKNDDKRKTKRRPGKKRKRKGSKSKDRSSNSIDILSGKTNLPDKSDKKINFESNVLIPKTTTTTSTTTTTTSKPTQKAPTLPIPRINPSTHQTQYVVDGEEPHTEVDIVQDNEYKSSEVLSNDINTRYDASDNDIMKNIIEENHDFFSNLDNRLSLEDPTFLDSIYLKSSLKKKKKNHPKSETSSEKIESEDKIGTNEESNNIPETVFIDNDLDNDYSDEYDDIANFENNKLKEKEDSIEELPTGYPSERLNIGLVNDAKAEAANPRLVCKYFKDINSFDVSYLYYSLVF